jgi:hypothetical protein
VLFGEILHALLFEINGTEDRDVLRFQTVENALKAAANLVLKFRGWLSRGLQFARPCFECPIFGNVSPITVYHCVAQQTVEPSHSRFAGLEVVLMLKGAQICGLEDVFGQFVIRDAALHEREELSALCEELVEMRFGHRKFWAGGHSLPPEFDVNGLLSLRADADYAATIRTAGTILAHDDVLLLNAKSASVLANARLSDFLHSPNKEISVSPFRERDISLLTKMTKT